jgi:hypothetical protein
MKRVRRALQLFQQGLIYLNDADLKSCIPEQKCKISVSGRRLWVGVLAEFKKQRSQNE